MSLGFGTTLGAGSTDKITTGITTGVATTRSWAIQTYRRQASPGLFGRIFDRAVDTGANQRLFTSSDGSFYEFDVAWSTTTGNWTITAPAAGAWHHLVVTYDAGSTANDPVIYLDGASVTVTRAAAPVGTLTSDASATILGNRNSNDRVWDGMLAEFAVWDRLLAASEAAALAKGFSPLFFPASLVEYALGAVWVTLRGPLTNVGTAVQPHPPVLSVVGRPVDHRTTTAPPPGATTLPEVEGGRPVWQGVWRGQYRGTF